MCPGSPHKAVTRGTNTLCSFTAFSTRFFVGRFSPDPPHTLDWFREWAGALGAEPNQRTPPLKQSVRLSSLVPWVCSFHILRDLLGLRPLCGSSEVCQTGSLILQYRARWNIR